jgi:cobalamin biosynthesis protein CbiG
MGDMSNGAIKRLAVDLHLLGQAWGWKQTEVRNLPSVEEVLRRGGPIAVIQDAGRRTWTGPAGLVPASVSLLEDWPLELSAYDALIVISDRRLPPLPTTLRARTLVYRPPTLTLGVSCFRRLDAEHLADSVALFFQRAGLAEESLTAVAAPQARKNEATLINFAEARAVPLLTYAVDKLALLASGQEARRRMAGLCEPSAMLAAGVTELAAPKQVFRRLALAAARRTWA